MCGFLQRFHRNLGLSPFYKPGSVLQEGICFRTADKERRHFELRQIPPQIKTLEAGSIDLGFPLWRKDQFISAVWFGSCHSFNIDSQILIAHIAEDTSLAIAAKNCVQIVEYP